MLAATSIDVSASVAAPLVNQPETFTATVTAPSGSSTPTGGTVTFLDAGTPIGTGTLANGKATFTTSSLGIGSHTITASYGGATGFSASRSGIEPTAVASTIGSGLTRPARTAVDSSGDVFIADSGNNRVLEIKPGGTTATVGTGLINPLAVAVDPSGDVFIADTGNNRVVEVKAGGTQTTVGSGFSEPYGVATDAAGDAFIADAGNNRVVEVTPGGVQTTVAATGLSFPTDMAVDASGDLFIADFSNNRVVEVKANGGGQSTIAATGLSEPAGVAVDTSGDVFIADFNNNRVVELKADGTQITIGSGLATPTGVSLDSSGDVFISDYGNSRVLEYKPGVTVNVTGTPTSIDVSASVAAPLVNQPETFTATVTAPAGSSTPTGGTVTFLDAGTPIGTGTLVNGTATFTTSSLAIGSHTITASYGGAAGFAASRSGIEPTAVASVIGSGLSRPARTAVDSAGDVFIADSGNNRVLEVKPGGATATVGTGLSNPLAVALDPSGDVFIADTGNNRVVEVKAGGTQSTVGSGFSEPYGVATDSVGDAFIADAGNNRVVEVTPVGVQTTVAATGLSFPTDVAVDASNDVFIADFSNNRVVEVKPGGVQSTVLGTGLSEPAGVAVDAGGDVFIADFGNNRVVELKADGTQATISSGLSTPTGVGLDASGDVFISDYGNSRVLEYKPGVTVNVTGLVVTSFTATSTGFKASFNEPFSLAQLNLYDTATAGFGPADVTLVGASTGPVRGSLIVSTDDKSITFVKTGGVLAPDTYTVTLRSAANAFQDTFGGLLDGNADGTPGDNYTTTFTAAPSTARVISIPDFARGPGQAVNIPATGAGLPLTISDGTGVTSIRLTLTYNAALLTITGASLGASAPAGSSVTVNTSTPGTAILTFTSPTALPAGLDTFATLKASVPNSAPYASKEVLDIGGLSVNGGAIAATDDDGVHVVAYLGDATGNGGYSGLDASDILRVVAGIDSGFAAYPLLDPIIAGDVTANGSLSGLDASDVLQFVAGLNQPAIPPLPNVTITSGGADPLIWIPQTLAGSPGQTLTVPVMFQQTNATPIGLNAADLAIEFDPSMFVVAGVREGSVPQGFTLTEAYDNATGQIIASLRSTSGSISLSPGAEGSLLLVDLEIRPGANPSASRINLLGEGRVGTQVVYTSLNDGHLTLIPAPTDSDADPVDGLVTVSQPSTTPAPSQPVIAPSAAPSTGASAPSSTVTSTSGLAPASTPVPLASIVGAGPASASAPASATLVLAGSTAESATLYPIPWSAPDSSSEQDTPGGSLTVSISKKARDSKVLIGKATPAGFIYGR